MKTAVIYARYSSDSQSEQSIEGQLRVCQQYAQANDLVIIDEYIDRAMTGTNDNRFAFQKMIKDSAKKQFSVILVYKLDRFSRNKYESVIHKKTLKDNGVKLVSAMENIPDTPEGTLMEALLEGFNQYYSEELTQKVNRGLRESWLKGNATGGNHIFGYDIKDKKYVINEYEKDIIIDVFTKYSQGYKAKAIAELLNEQGLHRFNGKPFTMKYILFILHNERYTGIVEHQGVVYDNIFPRIIEQPLWDKVNSINEENKISPSRKKEIFDYILSGKLVCGLCKRRMSGDSGTCRNKDIHYYYICTSKRKHIQDCELKSRNKEYLEDIVINTTAKLLKQSSNIDTIAETLFKLHQKITADDTNLNLLTKRRDEAVKSSQNIITAIEQGIITEMTKTRLVELEKQISELEYAINKEKQKNYSFLTIDNIKSYLKKKVFSNTNDIKIRKLLINTFVREIILYPEEIIIVYNFTEPIETPKIDKKTTEEIERQSQSALSLRLGSDKLLAGAPMIFGQKAHK